MDTVGGEKTTKTEQIDRDGATQQERKINVPMIIGEFH